MRKLYLNNRFFIGLGIACVSFILSFYFPFFYTISIFYFLFFIAALLLDVFLLYRAKEGIKSRRKLPDKLSNGDENWVELKVFNAYPFTLKIRIIDEIPFQFQVRDFELKETILPQTGKELKYALHPKERGEYSFGKLNIFVSSPLGLIEKRYTSEEGKELSCYPSFIHLNEYELLATKNEFLLGGTKKIRRIGHTLEFEQIKEYVRGDDVRTINWKATGKANRLMVNQYQEERAQRVYMLIDKGRVMKMPFNGLSLLDYAINASMALSHVILKRHDRAGVMTFSKKIENQVAAELKSIQLKKIADALYNIQTDFSESDFNRLYSDVSYQIKQRSLLLLFTNFETLDGLKRQIKYLRALAKKHLLVVVFFRNSEILQLVEQSRPLNIQEVYDQIIAEKFEFEKSLIQQELLKYGIHSVYTLPENLNIAVINKYLEIKSRGIL